MPQSISQRQAHVSCRGYGSIPQAHGDLTVNQGGTADKVVRPWQKNSFVMGVFYFESAHEDFVGAHCVRPRATAGRPYYKRCGANGMTKALPYR